MSSDTSSRKASRVSDENVEVVRGKFEARSRNHLDRRDAGTDAVVPIAVVASWRVGTPPSPPRGRPGLQGRGRDRPLRPRVPDHAEGTQGDRGRGVAAPPKVTRRPSRGVG